MQVFGHEQQLVNDGFAQQAVVLAHRVDKVFLCILEDFLKVGLFHFVLMERLFFAKRQQMFGVEVTVAVVD